MKTKFTVSAALLLMLTTQAAHAGFFLFIPRSVIDGSGNVCLGPSAKVGDEIRSANGDILVVNSISERSWWCRQSERPITAGVEFKSSERPATKVGLELPDYYEQRPLTDVQQFNGGVLLATHGATDTGIYVASLMREKVPDLDAYATRMRAELAKMFTVAHQTDIETLRIDGLEARRFETEGKIHGTSRTYVGTLLQGDNEIVWVNGWAPTGQYGRFKSELIHVSESVVGLRATPSETSVQAIDLPSSVRYRISQPAASPAGTVAPKGAGDQQKPDIAERLRKLRELYKDGLIDQQDYEAKKAEILTML